MRLLRSVISALATACALGASLSGARAGEPPLQRGDGAVTHFSGTRAIPGAKTGSTVDSIGIDPGRPALTGAEQIYYYRRRPLHLAEAGDQPALEALLTDPAWMAEKLAALGTPEPLIADYRAYAPYDTANKTAAASPPTPRAGTPAGNDPK
jgi:hypothetical protein